MSLPGAFSFDLKSATDRYCKRALTGPLHPVRVNSALATNIFQVPFVKRKKSFISFVAGPTLRLLFFVAPVCTFTPCVGVVLCRTSLPRDRILWLTGFLATNVVIADPQVAKVYEEMLGKLGVVVSYQKSLISSAGAAEFAKRFRGETVEG
ncbi:hypothetical protein Ancab_039462 [Ancistrocladus abbreviatus]